MVSSFSVITGEALVFRLFSFVNSVVHDFTVFSFGVSLTAILACRVLVLCYCVSSVCAVHDVFRVYGCQWLWDFEYVQFSVTCAILVESDFWVGDVRVVSSVCSVVILHSVSYKLWVSSVDVIHCFSVVMFSIKSDCVPGRVIECYVCCQFAGVFYGQCSELCGVLHGFMPFVLVCV